MIFVTVGTHEQQFNRLVECIDKLKEEKIIQEDVVIQTGFSTYEPQCCAWSKFFSYNDMWKFVKEARIVVTHGGPSSFIMPLQVGKIPIVFSRKKQFGEHVNDHQVDFSRQVSKRQGNIIAVEETGELENAIVHYDEIAGKMHHTVMDNNLLFCRAIDDMVSKMLKK